MSKKATVTIVLEYDVDGLRFMLGEDIAEEQFPSEAMEQAYRDLRNYLMSEPIENFATIKIEDN
jgi:hypothetical protein